jgi:pyruvate dehydrogenase E2 component (dihydrolipoamide acetyltransferase)
VPVGATIATLGEGQGDASNGASAQQQDAGVAEPIRVETPSGGTAAPVGDDVRASPVARRVAREHGIDLSTVRGSGPGGRIVKADVAPQEEPAAQAPAAQAPAAPAPTPPLPGRGSTAKGDVTEHELTRTQQVIARRMAESKATIPDFSITTEVDMERCVDLRAQLSTLGGPPPSYNDMVVRACGLALREHPKANGSYRDGRFIFHSRVNIGVAVAAEGALVVPTVFDADHKPLARLAEETRALAERVRAGVVTAAELGGGTFTVSNMGMHGVTEFEAVINPPQAAILAVGQVRPVPVARDGAVVVRHVLKATLVCDHRILYGADAAGFLARVRELLEAPATLLV